jgi:hypothetical protein
MHVMRSGSPPDTGDEKNKGVVAAAATGGARRRILPIALGGIAALATLFGLHLWKAATGKTRLETACASILGVVNPPGSTFEPMGGNLSTGDTVARLLYVINSPEGASKRAIILCAFDASSIYGQAPKLVAVSVNGNQFGPARIAFLNRFWLPSEEAAAALPSGPPSAPAQS